MKIQFTDEAAKELKKIGPVRDAILAKLEQYAADPKSLANNVKPLKGSDAYRLRAGNYRVLFVILEDGAVTIMEVTAVRHRSKAYD